MAIACAVLALTAASWRASGALYDAATTSAVSAATGSVAIGDDDGGSALLSVTGLRPGSSTQGCVRVTYTGTLPAAVRLYAAGLSTTNALSTYLDVTIEDGSGAASYPSCTGFAALAPGTPIRHGALSSMPTTFAAGLGSWTATTGAVRDYRITLTLMSTAPGSTANGSAGVTFTWEAQNS